ncbi:CHRD domain-containing protein [Ornithinimicrobium flavum]|uniref:CHRD domain-containing protein n=1 Tax=Ornithinimicrobium flavum TaxID=1288636 RepID=UPI001930EEC2|nr:CHRD domain-containing protein [Ornithinimicrobium flavum]
MHISRTLLALPAAGAAVMLLAGAPAVAATGSAMADLQPVPLNDAPGTGSAMFEVDGTMVDLTLAYQGLLADAPHAAHVHFGADARHACPTAEDDADGDGFLSTSDGGPAYGGIAISLTTEGDTSADSGLAIDRFGVGDDVSYARGGIEVDQATADAILAGEAVVVVHGVDHNGNGEYDEGDRGPSDLDPSLPGEATDPALCGVVQASQMSGVPSGGVDTGEAAPGSQNLLLAAGGGVALVGGALVLARRRTAAG